jgi:pyoverdine/dityrosine biosynthesis protein Dit1
MAFFIHRRKNIVQKYMEMVSSLIFSDGEEMSDMIKVSP